MNFTILTTHDLQFDQVLDLVKDGNTYDVVFTNKEQIIAKKFKTKKEAQETYSRIVNCFIDGTYSFEQRVKLLQGVE